ncbi:MAG: hypothetical protein E7K04_03445 [Helicobacter sp.]|nr:hypothetical protein [Helicobacter sp.]
MTAKKFFILLLCLCALDPIWGQDLAAKNPLATIENPISPIYYVPPSDAIRARKKTGAIFGAGIGLPSTTSQRIHGKLLDNTFSYGYRAIVGYQDYLQVLSFFPKGIFGARISLQTDSTFHLQLDSPIISATSYLLGYDILWDAFYLPNNNTAGFMLGFYVGATRISRFQDTSFDAGLRGGIAFNFGFDDRLEISYRIGNSGVLRSQDLYFYSPYTIDIMYSHRTDFFAQEPVTKTPILDNTQFLKK